MIDSEFSSAIFFCTPKPSETFHNQIQIFFKPPENADVDGSLLVSSIFYQTLEPTIFMLSFYHWYYTNSGWDLASRELYPDPDTYNYFYDVTADNYFTPNSP